MITRRHLLASAAAASLIRPRLLAAQTTGVTPVFIKWDAWYDDTQLVTQQFHQQLSPARWQFRAPFSCTVLGPERITCAGTQANMDIEIQAAANAGVKAWMQVWYGGAPNSPGGSTALHRGWQLYDASSYKNMVKWAVYTGLPSFGVSPYSNTAGWQGNCNYWVNFFTQPNYLKVGGRPVVFVAWSQTDLATYFANSTANTLATFNYLRSQSVAAGAGNPYIIGMDDLSGPITASQVKGWIGGDAISGYIPSGAIQFTALPETAATLYSRTLAHWGSQVASGDKTVPIALMGWDKRPRMELPGFSDGAGYIPWVGHQQYYARGTNAEIAGHLQACVDFIGANQPACDSKIMLVYAWNECAEGGTAGVPTLGDPPVGTPPSSALLNAIKPVLMAAA
jgi:hypothetical protein